MALTRITYTNTNSATTTYAFSFDVLSTADINVEIDDTVIPQNSPAYPWEPNSESNPTAIVFTGATNQRPNGERLVIYRDTDRTALYKTFTNEPLNATDLNKSFEKILYIQQEAFDYIDETNIIIGEGGAVDVPQPLPEQDDHFLVSENASWTVKSPAEVASILEIDFASDLEVNTLKANTSVSSVSVSATSGTIDTLSVDSISGSINILDDGQDFTIIKNTNAQGPIVFDSNGVVFKVDGEEKFRIGNLNANNKSLIHNYGDSLPAYYQSNGVAGIALSGTGRVFASNTAKGIAYVSGVTGSIGLTPDTYGVSSVVRNSGGNYTFDIDTDAIPNVLTDKLIYILDVYQTNLASQIYRPYVTGVTGNSVTVQMYADPVGSTTADANFSVIIY